MQPAKHREESLSVNDADYIRVRFLYANRSTYVRSLGQSLSGRPRLLFAVPRAASRKNADNYARCFEVARNSHPRNANYVQPYEHVCAHGILDNDAAPPSCAGPMTDKNEAKLGAISSLFGYILLPRICEAR